VDDLLRQINHALSYTQELLVVGLVLARTMPMVIQTPLLGGKIAPPELKMGFGVMFTVVMWPLARGSISIESVPITPVPFLLLMLKEVFIGFCIGYVNSLVFTIMEMAGRLIDTARGSSMAEVMVPHSGTRETPFGDLYYQLLLVIFVAVGAHGVFFEAFAYSFSSIPLTTSLPDLGRLGQLSDYMIRLTSEVLLSAVLLAAPVLAAVLVTDVVFGILNRVAPQLNAYFMAMPVKAVGAVMIVLAVMEAFIGRLTDYTVWNLKAIERTIELLSKGS
jgi:flagellar biosynthesis protein FliR